MTVSGASFLLIFLPLVIVSFGMLHGGRMRLLVLLGASLIFYAFTGGVFLFLLLGLSWVTFIAGRKQATLPGIIINLAALVAFKLWAAPLSGASVVLGTGAASEFMNSVFLPLGISYYVFKHIGYLIDVRKETTAPESSFLRWLTFSTYFPQISAGPISRYADTGEQLKNLGARISSDRLYQALLFISIGLGKKTFIADPLQMALRRTLYDPETRGSGAVWAWITLIAFGLQLYVDFSSYTDIVLGVSRLFGIRLPPNFRNPYRADSIRSFWRSWHMSLTEWFRIYLFSPISRVLIRFLGRERRTISQDVSNLLTMGLIGLWHGIGWSYMLWGLYHGFLLNVESALDRYLPTGLIRQIYRLLVPLLIMIGWIFFLPLAGSDRLFFIQTALGMHGLGAVASTLASYGRLVLGIMVLMTFLIAAGMTEAADFPQQPSIGFAVLWGVLFFGCLLLQDEPIAFAYINF